MTPKEKAINLFNSYVKLLPLGSNVERAKQGALIAVDEILKSSPLDPNNSEEWLQPEDWFSDANISAEKYWQEVKQEIENL